MAVKILEGGPDISIPLVPGSHVDTHPSGGSLVFLFLLMLFLFGDHGSMWGPYSVLGDCTGGTGCRVNGCLDYAVNDDASGVPQKKIN